MEPARLASRERENAAVWKTGAAMRAAQRHIHLARIPYDSWGGSWRGRGKWSIDYPESDLNMSFRLQQLTALQVDPEGTVLNLTEDKLFHYPFIYIIEPGELTFSGDEVKALRKYLLTGGFLMVDDFWGEGSGKILSASFGVFPDA
ncbi:MAG: hypothetical protein Ct9H300mP32_6140 [Verrucomicrobiota bacterium]|nr:MAG: hypothetical protein Ct9H300mP32_6140 [Verrucomicrobiota bacterium]